MLKTASKEEANRPAHFPAHCTLHVGSYISPRSTALETAPVLGFSGFPQRIGINMIQCAETSARLGFQRVGSSPPKGGSTDVLCYPLGFAAGMGNSIKVGGGPSRLGQVPIEPNPDRRPRARRLAFRPAPCQTQASAPRLTPLVAIAGTTPRSVNGVTTAPGRSRINAAPGTYTLATTPEVQIAAWLPQDEPVRGGERVRTVLIARLRRLSCRTSTRARARDRERGSLTALLPSTRPRACDRGVPR